MSAGNKLSILLADDHPLIREGFKRLLNDQPDMTVVAEASNGPDALDLARTLTPGVALIDVSDPTENLVWEIEELTKRSRTKCVFICQRERAGRVVTGSLEGPYDDQVAHLLELEEILAYTTDRRGRRRFARALRGTLMSMTT